MAKFCKKPVVVEAYQFTREMVERYLFDKTALPTGVSMPRSTCNPKYRTIGSFDAYVVTIHGQQTKVVPGDWIITEPDGVHFYPCKPDIFEATYEPVAEEST